MNMTTVDLLKATAGWDPARRADLERQLAPRGVVEESPRPSKYHNERVMVDGINFASKKEASHYRKLKLLQQAGEVEWFIMQVPFRLTGGVRYVADFVVKWKDGRVSVQDAKGMKTDVYRIKAKQMKELYQEVEEV